MTPSPIVEHEDRLGTGLVSFLSVDLHGMTFRRETHAMGARTTQAWGWVRRTPAGHWEWHLAPDAHGAAVWEAERELREADELFREVAAEALEAARRPPSWIRFRDDEERSIEAGHRAWTAGR